MEDASEVTLGLITKIGAAFIAATVADDLILELRLRNPMKYVRTALLGLLAAWYVLIYNEGRIPFIVGGIGGPTPF
jgi:hypothetical protein